MDEAREGPAAASGTGSRALSWLAWALAGLAGAMLLAAVALFVAADPAVPGDVTGGVLIPLAFLSFPVVGALIAARLPRNPIGWILLADGLLWMLLLVVEGYRTVGLSSPGSVPFPIAVSALAAWTWVPTVGLLGTFLVLLFPDGRLPSRRWRFVAWASAAVILVESVATLLMPGEMVELGGLRNPFGLEGHPWIRTVAWIALPLLPVCMVLSAGSLVARYRRAGGEVRQQIKWIALAASLMGLLYLGIMTGGLVSWLLSGSSSELGSRSLVGALVENVMVLSFVGIPVSIGFAIFRYRLYDIEVIINRTLVYASLTATLAAVYVGSVASLQYVLRELADERSQLVVVASTLLIAALFSPLRRRIQAAVDRRFYRSKYDARRSLEAFSAKLRDETDLNALGGDVVGLVRETLHPAHASLWLRAAGRPDGEATLPPAQAPRR